MERNGIYVDYKFRRLKEVYPGIKCGALVEATQIDLPSLREWVGAVMPHADWIAFTMEELVTTARGWCGVGVKSPMKVLL